MPRHTPSITAGIYLPTHQRHAYGRRSWSTPLVEPWWLPRREVPMPRGGTRTLLGYPRCQQWAAKLYNLDWVFPQFCWQGYACRACAGLRYRSQYQRRRPEAAHDRIEQLSVAAGRAKNFDTYQRRFRRYARASELYWGRIETHLARRDVAITLTLLVLIAREVGRENRHWHRILLAVLRASPGTRRHIAANPDTPAWVHEQILASLTNDTAIQSTPNNENRSAADEGFLPPDDALIADERIAELRAQYRALGHARRRANAA
jgi:hypothetical protein